MPTVAHIDHSGIAVGNIAEMNLSEIEVLIFQLTTERRFRRIQNAVSFFEEMKKKNEKFPPMFGATMLALNHEINGKGRTQQIDEYLDILDLFIQ